MDAASLVPSWAQSKPTRKMSDGWGAWPDVVARNATRLRDAEKAAKGAPLDFVLYGDSITAFLNGYSVSSKVPGSEQVWKKHFGKLRAVALGVAGDQVGNVLWRLVNAERPATSPKIIGLHIGVNDLIGWGTDGTPPTPSTIARLGILVRAIATLFPTSITVVFALTPVNGTALRQKRAVHNAAAKKLVDTLRTEGTRVVFADCTAAITAASGGPSKRGILGDGVHLTAAGHDAHLKEMRGVVDTILGKLKA